MAADNDGANATSASFSEKEGTISSEQHDSSWQEAKDEVESNSLSRDEELVIVPSPISNQEEPTAMESCVENDGSKPVEESSTNTNSSSLLDSANVPLEEEESTKEAERLRLMEEMHIGTANEILFPASSSLGDSETWDNLRWMSLSGSRQIAFSRIVFRRMQKQSNVTILGLFSQHNQEVFYSSRLLILYKIPRILLLLRRAVDLQELSKFTEVDYSNSTNPTESIMNQYWIAENAVDLATCKLHRSALTTHFISGLFQDNKIQHPRDPSVFQILSPNALEKIFLSPVQVRNHVVAQNEMSFDDSGAFMETVSTETAIIQAICEAHQGLAHVYHPQDDDDQHDLTWMHQIILGTLHSQVLSGNVKALRQALERAWRNENRFASNPEQQKNSITPTLPQRIIDQPDDSDRTPLYYACQREINDAMDLLIKYGATLDFVNPGNQDSLLHICARRLNHKGLTILLSYEKININALNLPGHTQLYTALVYGKRAGGRLDWEALENYLQISKDRGGTLFGNALAETSLHPLLALSLQYRAKDLAVLLNFLHLDFPLTGNLDISLLPFSPTSVVIEESLAALYGYPLHRVLANLYHQIISNVAITNLNKENIVGTVRLLLQAGFEVNERMELSKWASSNDPLVSSFVGFAPIQILTVIAMELQELGPNLGEFLYGTLDAVVSELCEELVRNGARLSLEKPFTERKRQNLSSPRDFPQSPNSTVTEDSTTRAVRSKLDNIANSETLVHLLGGRERLKKAQASFSALGAIAVDASRALRREDSSNIPDSLALGGNNDRSCAICWKTFGTLMNRKHRCRISWRHLCDECSTKRILIQGKEYRVSDGQFIRSRAMLEQVEINKKMSAKEVVSRHRQQEPIENLSSSSSSVHLARARQERLEAEQKASRDSLFGGDFMQQASDFLFGPDEPQGQSMDGLMNTLGETRNALLDRGAKLDSLSEKSAQMVSASQDFAKMASELRKKSEKGLFW